MDELSGCTPGDLPGLIQKWRRPADLEKLVRAICDHDIVPRDHRTRRKGIAKVLFEEVVPLYFFGLAMEAGANGNCAPFLIKPILGNQGFDAKFRPAGARVDEATLLEITQAKIDGYQDGLADEYRAKHGHSSPYARYRRQDQRKDRRQRLVYEVDPPEVRERSGQERRIVDAAVNAVRCKNGKRYPDTYWLLVWLDEYNPDGLSKVARDDLIGKLSNLSSLFERIVVMGFATKPIIIRGKSSASNS